MEQKLSGPVLTCRKFRLTDVGWRPIKMKANFSSVISVLVIMLIISGMIPGMASAADEEGTDPGDSTSDLVIEDISCDQGNPELGETVNVAIKVTNQGTAVSGLTEAVCKIGDEDLKNIPIQEIKPKDSLIASFAWTPKKEGTVDIKATLGDSEKTIQVVVGKEKSANLIIEGLSIDPENPKPNSEVTVNALVKNGGTAASEPTELTYEIGELGPKTEKVDKIDPEASSSVSFKWTPDKEGTVNIKAKVGDSEKTIQVVVAKEKSSNLAIKSLSINPENPKTNSEVTVSASVKNEGTEVSEPTNIIFTINGDEKKEVVSEIEAGSEQSISHKWTTSDKEETVTIKAALENVENSEKEITVETIGEPTEDPLPDLIIEDLYPESSTQPEAGKPFNFTVKIKNGGTATASSSTAKYSFNGTSEGEISIPELSAGSSTSAGFSFTPGNEENINVLVVADPGNTVNESNEENNKMSKVINIKNELPDLKIESISMSPEEPHPGEDITFTVTVKNDGYAAAGSSEINYYIKGNNEDYTGVTSIPALAAGESGVGTFFWTLGNQGQIEIKTVIDPGNVVSESDETNNELTKTATVYEETVSSNDGGTVSNSDGGSESSESSSSSGGGRSRSSSGGSGGAIVSKEPANNVDAKELSTKNVLSGYHVKFDFLEDATCIEYIAFDPIKTLKKTTTTVEMLKDKSVFVLEVPPGKIYKYVNIWVGNHGAGVADYFENGVIEFKVEKDWLEENNIKQSQITLQWYNEGWQPLNTEKVKEDENYVYFKSETPGFSCFAITKYTDDKNVSETSGQGEEGVLINLDGEAKTDVHNVSSEKSSKIKNPMGKAKILMAISLPLFLILVEYFVMRKKI